MATKKKAKKITDTPPPEPQAEELDPDEEFVRKAKERADKRTKAAEGED